MLQAFNDFWGVSGLIDILLCERDRDFLSDLIYETLVGWLCLDLEGRDWLCGVLTPIEAARDGDLT